MKNSLETLLGIFIALAMIAAFFIFEIIGGVNLLKPGFHVKAAFANIQDLKIGDPVKISGVPVGQVEKIGLDSANGKVELTLRINKDAPVHTDSIASVKYMGLLGANFVALTFGTATAPLATESSHLNTTEQPDLSAIMAKFDEAASGVQTITRSFSGEKIDNLVGPFVDFMKVNNPKITAIISHVNTVSAQIAEGKGTVGKLINDDALHTSALAAVTNLEATAGEIKQTIAQVRSVVDQVNAGQGTVGKLVKDEALYKETTATMTNLKEIMQKVNQGQGSVGKLINDQEFYNNAKLSLQKLDKATESLEDTGPLSILGSMINSLL